MKNVCDKLCLKREHLHYKGKYKVNSFTFSFSAVNFFTDSSYVEI